MDKQTERLKESYKAIFSEQRQGNIKNCLRDSRFLAEKLCFLIFKKLFDELPGKMITLEGYLTAFKGNNELASDWYLPLEVIQKYGNFGSHYNRDVDVETLPKELAQPCLSALDTLVNLYFKQYTSEDITFREGRITSNTRIEVCELETIGGAIPLGAKFYVERPTDKQFEAALIRKDPIILLRGSRQIGKTSLLARGLQKARNLGVNVVVTDFQKLCDIQLRDLKEFVFFISDMLAEQLALKVSIQDIWINGRDPIFNFNNYFCREVLEKVNGDIIWAIDETDKILNCGFKSNVFSLFRSWHDSRALTPNIPFNRFTMVIASVTDTYHFITDLSISQFDVATKLVLEHFTLEQVDDLNQRHGLPLKNFDELQKFYELVGGQPYLVRKGFFEIVSCQLPFETFVQNVQRSNGTFEEHLQRIARIIKDNTEFHLIVQQILCGQPCLDYDAFIHLRNFGIINGNTLTEAKFNCVIYEDYLRNRFTVVA